MNQLAFSLLDPSESTCPFSDRSSEERGSVFTRREVVDFILDLVGYTIDHPLRQFRLIEPAFGDGGFLLPVVERLLTAYRTQVQDGSAIVDDLSAAIRAVEVHGESIDQTRAKLLGTLRQHGVSTENARNLLDAWIIEGDFLLVDLPHPFTHAVGNPPYVRQELIPDTLMAQYRTRYRTIYDRADLYVPFIERCLTHLQPGGTLGFICADRWMKNKYGAPLRALVAGQYHLACYVDMMDTPAFDSEVSAYPAITIIKREKPGPTRIAHRPRIDHNTLAKLAQALCAEPVPHGGEVVEVADVVRGREPWMLQSFDRLAIARRLEADFPTLEEAGCKVGIGVATGADQVFIGPFDRLDVEPDRKLPLVGTQDIEEGTVKWRGLGVINPFREDGCLAALADYPKLARYFERHADVIRRRNCAKRNPRNWYRTIDRIYPELSKRPKLLIPDIKGDAHIVYEAGHFYPHHNLYFITSDEWDLQALQAVLRSGIAKLFVSIYSTRMRGGYLRFQAQYLRRIRLPRWWNVPESIRQTLVDAARTGDVETCNRAVFDLYRLTTEQWAAIGGNGARETP
ncbi:MAG: TaqI-like C-terminal specificity domain-containing protein [Candidatus Competibacter sp.]|nr:TaqI-like C-terminal specificity domain-containing protein [Candidatus Competibacter sp.]